MSLYQKMSKRQLIDCIKDRIGVAGKPCREMWSVSWLWEA